MSIEVRTIVYECSHGARPRGRGSWAFTFDQRDYVDMDLDVFWASGLYAEAKRAAIVEARKRGARVVYVQS